MWYRTLGAIGALLCALTLNQFFGVDSNCAYDFCKPIVDAII